MIRMFVLSFAGVWRIPAAGYADMTKVLLLLLAFGSSGLAQTHVLVAKVATGRVCNLETDVRVSDSTTYSGRGLIPWDITDDAAIHNLAVFNAAFDRVGHGNGVLGNVTDDPDAIYDPLYFPGKTYYCRPGWVIARVGGSLLTGGGYQYDWFEVQRGLGLGSLTKIVFIGGSNSMPCVSYQTYGWKIGLISFWAYRVATQPDSVAEANGTLARRAVCFDVKGTYTAVGGLRSEGMYFDGFTDCVHFDGAVINGDRCHWDYLGMRYCNNLIHCENEQSVFDSVGHAEAYSSFDYLFKFDKGGDFTVTDSCSIEGGTFGIEYIFDSTTTNSDPGNGKLRLGSGTQNISTTIRADLIDAGETPRDATNFLNSLGSVVYLVSQSDSSKFLAFHVSAVDSSSGYRNITVSNVSSSTANPFSNGDHVNLISGRGTILYVNNEGVNCPRFTINGVGIDNTSIPAFKLLEVGSSALRRTVTMNGKIDNFYSWGTIDGFTRVPFIDDPLVVLPADFNLSTNKVSVRLDIDGISPTMAADYPR